MDVTQRVGFALAVGAGATVLFVLQWIFMARHMAQQYLPGARGKAQVERQHDFGRQLQNWAGRRWPVAGVLVVVGGAMMLWG